MFIRAGLSDVGIGRKIQEDYIHIYEWDHYMLCIVADGSGSTPSSLQPAAIVTSEVSEMIQRIGETAPEMLDEHARFFLKESLLSANKTLGAFKKANEEIYSGFGSSMTACLFNSDNNTLSFAHIGNTRLYLIRKGKDGLATLKLLSQDQTKAKELFDQGMITNEQYYFDPSRLEITGALGFITDPVIQTFKLGVKNNDIFLICSDGIHYAIRPEAIQQIILESEDCEHAASNLIQAAKLLEYNDNMSAIVVYTSIE